MGATAVMLLQVGLQMMLTLDTWLTWMGVLMPLALAMAMAMVMILILMVLMVLMVMMLMVMLMVVMVMVVMVTGSPDSASHHNRTCRACWRMTCTKGKFSWLHHTQTLGQAGS